MITRAAWLLVLASGCESVFPLDPPAVQGNYSGRVTNGENGCQIAFFNPGDEAVANAIVVQERDRVTATVDGVLASGLDLLYGSHAFVGTADDLELTLGLAGTIMANTNGCVHTFTAELTATSTADVLSGRLRHLANGDGSTECMPLMGCESVQDFVLNRESP